MFQVRLPKKKLNQQGRFNFFNLSHLLDCVLALRKPELQTNCRKKTGDDSYGAKDEIIADINLLSFGGKYFPLLQAFCVINIKIIKSWKNTIDLEANINDILSQKWINGIKNNNALRDYFEIQEKWHKSIGFSYNFIDKRYLIIIGCFDSYSIFNQSILYFDTKKCINNGYKCDITKLKLTCKPSSGNNETALITKTDGTKRLYIFCSKFKKYNSNTYNDQILFNDNCNVEISWGIDWKQERLIWIGFHKEKDSSCFIGDLPKDIVWKILLFLRNDNIFTFRES